MSVRPHGKLVPQLADFHEILYLRIFRKNPVDITQVSLKSDQKNRSDFFFFFFFQNVAGAFWMSGSSINKWHDKETNKNTIFYKYFIIFLYLNKMTTWRVRLPLQPRLWRNFANLTRFETVIFRTRRNVVTIKILNFTSLLTLILLTWRIRWAPNNVSKWQMGFNLAFKGLMNL